MKTCMVKSREKYYICNSEFEHKKGDKVWWKCGEDEGWGEVVVINFPLNPNHYNHCTCDGEPIGRILGMFIPTKAYEDVVKKETKNKFKVWCETREERDEVLAALSLDGIGVGKPFDLILLNTVPVGIHVFGDKFMLCRDRDVFNESDAPEKKLYEKYFFVNVEK